MSLSLSNFEQEVVPTIVYRGYDYYKQGFVNSLEALDDGEFLAFVDGTELYTIEITVNGDLVEALSCDCPYDNGPVCKHEVAVLYMLREQFIYPEANNNSNSSVTVATLRLPQSDLAEQIKSTIQLISKDALNALVLETALNNREFRAALLRKAPKPLGSAEDLKPIYIKQIKDCLEAVTDRHGFIDYSHASQSLLAADELLDEAIDYLANDQYEEVFPIVQAVIETLYPALQNVDDSNGSYGGAIGKAWELFREAAQNIDSTSTLAAEIFEYCLAEVNKEKYRGWFEENTFFDIAAQLVQEDQRLNQLFEILKKPKVYESDTGAYSSRFDQSGAIMIMIEVLNRMGKQPEAQALINENLHFAEIREEALQQAYKNNDYKKVKDLANGGVIQAEKDGHRGTLHKFEEWLLTIAEKEENLDTTQFYLRKFFFDRFEFSYYDRLKNTYSNNEWQDILPQLIEEVNHDKQPYNDALLKVYIREERWDDFLKAIKHYCLDKTEQRNFGRDNLSFLDSYHKPLADHYPADLILLYSKAIKDSLLSAKGRQHYQYVCQILRRMEKIEGQVEVEQIARYCRLTYSNRRALLDELMKI